MVISNTENSEKTVTELVSSHTNGMQARQDLNGTSKLKKAALFQCKGGDHRGGPEAAAQPAEQFVVLRDALPQGGASRQSGQLLVIIPCPCANQPQQRFYNIPWLLLFVF